MLHRSHASRTSNGCSNRGFHGYLLIRSPLGYHFLVQRHVLQNLCTWCPRICRSKQNSCLPRSLDQRLIPCHQFFHLYPCLLYTSPSPRDGLLSRMPSSA